jgi:hypothetical protein
MPPQTTPPRPAPAAPALAPDSPDPQAPQSLAERVRARYPGAYDDLSDVDLETRVKAKYPGAYDDLPTAAEVSPQGMIPGASISVPVSQAVTTQPMGGVRPPPAPPMSRWNIAGYGLTGEQARVEAARLPETARESARVALPAAGGIAGAFTGGVPGAAIGSVLGEAASMAVETATGAPPSRRELITRPLTAGALSAVTDLGVSKVAIPVGRRVLAPFAHKVTDMGRAAMDALGGHVTPGQVTDSRFLNLLDNIMEGSLFGGGQYRQFVKQQGRALDQMIDRLPEAVGAPGRETVEQVGKSWQTLQGAARESQRQIASQLYARVDEVAAATTGSGVSLAPVVEIAERQMQDAPEMARALAGKAGRLPPTIQRTGTEVIESSDEAAAAGLREMATTDPTMLRAIAGAGPGESPDQVLLLAFQRAGIEPSSVQARQVTFTQAHRIKSELGRIKAEGKGKPIAYLAGQYETALDDAMTQAAGGADTPLRQTYDAATKEWRTLKETFDRGLLAKVAKQRPHLVVNQLIQPHAIDDIVKAKNAVGADGWNQVKGAFLQKLLAGRGDSTVTGAELMNRLGKYGPETVEAVFGQQAADIWKIGRILATVQKAREGTGGVWIQLTQAGAAGGLLLGSAPGKALTVLLTPVMMSRVLLSAPARRWLTIGMRAPAGSKEAVQASAQLLAFLGREGLVSHGGPPGAPPRPPEATTGRGGGPGMNTGAVNAPPGRGPASPVQAGPPLRP